MAGKITRAIRRRSAKENRSPRNLPHLASRLFGTPLFVDGRKLDTVIPIFEAKINGKPEPAVSDSDWRDDSGNMTIDTDAGIAIIPVIGSLVRRPTWLDAYSGLTSYGEVAECLDNAINDARVKGIILQIDSFGGEAAGCFELCDAIYAARGPKPIWAIADVDALSAGYAILSSADQCFSDPAGSTGSIGVVAIHCERSQQNAAMGITYTVFRAGDRKAEFNPYEKLTSAASIKMLTSMEKMRDRFVSTVARNRGIDPVVVSETEGQWYDPDDAKELGLINGILTFDQVFSNMAELIASPPADPEDAEISPPPANSPDDQQESDGEDDPDDGDGEDNDELPDDIPEEQTSEVIQMAEHNASGATPPARPIKTPSATTATATPPATAEVVALDSARPNAESRELQIANLCKVAGMPELAADFIMDATKSVSDVQTALINKRASDNAAPGELSNSHPGNRITGFASQASSQEAVNSWGGAFKKAREANPAGFPQLQQHARR